MNRLCRLSAMLAPISYVGAVFLICKVLCGIFGIGLFLRSNPFLGVLERMTIGSFILWLFLAAAMMCSSEATRASSPAK